MATSSLKDDRGAWDWNRVEPLAWRIGTWSMVICALGTFVFPATFYRSYLVAYSFWFHIGVGSLAMIMLWHVTGGYWGTVLQRLLEASIRTLPLLAVLFLPLLLGIHHIYEWSHADVVAADPVLQHKSIYLNIPWFIVRAAVCFGIWILLARRLDGWSQAYDRSPDPRWLERMKALSAPGLVLYALTVSVVAIDWVMSLEPHWFSTIFALVFAAGQLLTAFGFMLLVLPCLAEQQPALAALLKTAKVRDLGNLLLMLVMFWTYVSFSQFLLIWYGNLPEETVWFTARLSGAWKYIAVGLLLLQFFLPFFVLLLRQVKENVRQMSALAGLVLVMSLVNLIWMIIPAFEPAGLLAHGLDLLAVVVATVGVGGLWVAVFLRQLQRRPTTPRVAVALSEESSHG